ncbi:MAG: DUF805 domain-containing protein [Synergistaceae bacterium]|nr:DUF805 domain-containing protein [Synergistaceae bacterium]
MDSIKKFFSVIWFYSCVCFKKYFDFSGRARRKEYWSFAFFTWAIGNLLAAAYSLFDFNFINILSHLYAAFILIPSLAVAFRRAHDIGYSGAYVVLGYALIIVATLLGTAILVGTEAVSFRIFAYALFIFPIAIILAYFYFFTRDSQACENKWGANPKELEN